MIIPCQGRLLRIYSNVNEAWHGAPLYRAVVETARRLKLAGASVFPVELGYGTHKHLHDIASEYSSFDIPIVVEVVEASEGIETLLAELAAMVSEGLVAVSAVHVLRYAHGSEREASGVNSAQVNLRAPDEPALEVRGQNPMKIEGEGKRLTVYVGSADTWGGRNLAVAIVEKCRAMGIAGATVSRGIMGFGKHSIIHKAHLLGLSDDLPEKIEVVDRPEEIDRLLPVVDDMIGGGLIVVEDVHIIRYLHDPKVPKK
jgi:PII-like signaling protein